MAIKSGIGLSPLTDKIYMGKQNTEKGMWVGEKKDITDNFIDVMFQYLELNEAREIVTENIDEKKETKHFFIHFKDDKESLQNAINFMKAELKKLK